MAEAMHKVLNEDLP